MFNKSTEKLDCKSIEEALEVSQVGVFSWKCTNPTSFICSKLVPQHFGFERQSDFQDASSELYSVNIEDLQNQIHPDDWATLRGVMVTLNSTKAQVHIPFRVLFENGEWHWLNLCGQFGFDQNGTVVSATGSITDLNEMQILKQELRSLQLSKDTAVVASQQKSAFLANMSHEIRSPLGVILGYAELLADQKLEASERSEYFQMVARNGHQVLALIDDILDLSKVEAGKLEFERQRIRIRTLFDDIYSALKPRAAAKGITLRFEMATSIPEYINSDPVRLRQIVFNLVSNAINFTKFGRVDCIVETVPSDIGKTPGSRLQIRIKDTGVGISVESQKSLFDLFYRGDQSVINHCGGTGLGLALSRKLSRLLGGDVMLVASEVGKGSEFMAWIDMNLVANSNKNSQQIQERQPRTQVVDMDKMPLKGVRILVAEDSPDSQALIRRILLKLGAVVEMAFDGQDAIERVHSGKFDIILMDLQMPRLDGFEATKKLRDDNCHLPVIAITGHAMKEEKDRCLSAGCTDHLAKPISSVDLVDMISRYIPH
jgi:signal transduction histidine kinase/ActR/RegA family two-component response regulator